MRPQFLTPDEARRMALAAQGFQGQPRRTRIDWHEIETVLNRLHLLQIDSVNVLVRSHYLPIFSRAGLYDMAAFDTRTLRHGERYCFECWAHEASLVPLKLHPLMRWRMSRARRGHGTYRSLDRFAREERPFLRQTLRHIASNGPIRASDVPGGGKAESGWWGWSKGKMALETLFDQGLVSVRERQGFERVYDLTERVIPADILTLQTPSEKDALRQLIVLSARALGIGSAYDLRDYFRLPVAETKTALAEALEAGELVPVRVAGWSMPAYAAALASVPPTAGGSALISPFDPLVWNRQRAERLFNFHYRIELYTPQHKRNFGYYVLPFLFGDRLVARVCLKSERQAGVLRVNAAYLEAGADAEAVAAGLAAELRLVCSWLGLGAVAAPRKGNLARMLARALKQTPDTSR